MTVEGTKSDQQPEKPSVKKPDEHSENVLEAAPEPVPERDEPVVQPGRVIKQEELEEIVEYPEEERAVLTKLYEKTLTEFGEGEIVKGNILSISGKEVAVDIGFKSEGVISIDEFKSPEDLKVGDAIEIFLDKMEDSDGQLKLSKEKADFVKIWEEVVRKHESGELIEGRIVRRIKGGMVVDLIGIDAFLPGSQIDVKPVRDFDSLIGKTMEFRIVKVNNLRKNIVVSRRVIIEEGLSEQRESMLKDLAKGQVRVGVVKNITDFGVFVDLGGVDGLLHITDLSWGRVAHPSEIVSFDQQLEVVVLDFDKEKQRVSLGLKQLQPHPWENIEEKYPVGKKVTGKVVSITDYGAFVELEKGIEGLIHISEMSWTQHIKHPSKILSIGEQVEAIVLNFDKEDKKISLGLKQTEPDPWMNVVTKYPVGSKHSGTVRNVTNFGVFVELEEGIDGLVHISDLSWTKKVRHPSEIVKKGDEIDVIILNVSVEDRRISLGHKQVEENPWDTFEADFKKDVVTVGKVVRPVEKGLIVELPGGVEGFIPSSHLLLGVGPQKPPKNQLHQGEELHLKVIEFDKENKKIVLSQTEYEKDRENQDVQEYLDKQQEKTADVPETGETPVEKAAPEESAEQPAEAPSDDAGDALAASTGPAETAAGAAEADSSKPEPAEEGDLPNAGTEPGTEEQEPEQSEKDKTPGDSPVKAESDDKKAETTSPGTTDEKAENAGEEENT